MYVEVNLLGTTALFLVFMTLMVAGHSRRTQHTPRYNPRHIRLFHRERRLYPRYGASLRIRYKTESGEGISWIKDISMGGARLFLNNSLKNIEPGVPFEIEISLPHDAQPVFIKGNIIWSKESDAGFQFGEILRGDLGKIMHYATCSVGNNLNASSRLL